MYSAAHQPATMAGAYSEGRLADINELAQRGKDAKGRNLWDEEWEDGVAAYIEAYDKQMALFGEIEEWVFKHDQHRASSEIQQEGRGQSALGRWGIALAIASILIGLVSGYVLTRYASRISIPNPTPTMPAATVPVTPDSK